MYDSRQRGIAWLFRHICWDTLEDILEYICITSLFFVIRLQKLIHHNTLELFLSSNIASILFSEVFFGAYTHRPKMNGQNTEQVPTPLPRAPRNFPNAKTRNEKQFDNWTLEIIPFIWYLIQMDRTERVNFFGGKSLLLIVIQLCYNELWPFSLV